jgi:hypothetical protein
MVELCFWRGSALPLSEQASREEACGRALRPGRAARQGEYDSSDVGRTPSVVEEEIFSYGRPTESLEDIKSQSGKK